MIKLKRKKGEKFPAEAPSGVPSPASGGSAKRHRAPSEAVSRDLPFKKKAKASSASSLASQSKESPAASSSAAPDKIDLVGGSVDCGGLRRAICALCRHVQKQQKNEDFQDLLGGSGGPTVCLMFSLQNIPAGQRIYPHLIELPFSPQDASGEVCLIVRDPQRKWKDLVAAAQPSLSFVSRVISYRKLQKKFPQFADKRNLCSSFDLFMVDTTVKEKVYNTLGKAFFSTNKLPLPIRMGPSTLEREVLKAHKSTPLVIKRGPSLAIRIGRALGAPEQLCANAEAAIRGVSEFFQQNHKWKNTITTIHVQATNTPALPVYVHPKYAQAAEYYAKNKPPSADPSTGEEEAEKNKHATQDNAKYMHQVADTRKIKRGKEPDTPHKHKGGDKSAKHTGAPAKEKKAKHGANSK